MNNLSGTFDQISARLDTLEKRVYALEHPTETSPELAVIPAPAHAVVEDRSFAQASGLFSILGRAMLGIAGAYVLRAVAESTSLPKLAVAAIAIAYAILWLVWAVRVKATTWFPRAIYAGTSSVILAPMLWELTLRFKVFPPSATAAIIALFVLIASAMAWKRNLIPVFWVTNATAAVVALALAIATRHLIPFITSLLFMVLICEFAAKLNRGTSVRPLVAVAADLSILGMIFIYSGPQNARVDYPLLGMAALLVPGCVLFLLYIVSIGIGAILQGNDITVFETIQAVAAFLLAAFSVLIFSSPLGAIVLGGICLLLAATCYILVLADSRELATKRNYQIFSAWGMSLLLAGSFLCLPPLGVTLCLGFASIASTLLGIRLHRLTFQIHGMLLLMWATAFSGLFGYVLHTLIGTLPVTLTASVGVASVATLIFYAAGKAAVEETWVSQSIRFVSAALAVCALAAFLSQGLLFLLALYITPEIHHVAFIRTLTCCAVALSVAFAGSRWSRRELTNIGYVTLAFIAAKLLFEDLRHGHFGFIAGSIFLFAISLIAAPRLARLRPKL